MCVSMRVHTAALLEGYKSAVAPVNLCKSSGQMKLVDPDQLFFFLQTVKPAIAKKANTNSNNGDRSTKAFLDFSGLLSP